MKKQKLPILEFDRSKSAIIEPSIIVKPNDAMPAHCVICFFQDVIDGLLKKGMLSKITSLRTEMGPWPIYQINETRPPTAIFHPGCGASLAAALFEEVIVLGGRKFIVCGGAGTLDSTHKVGALIVPVSAIRDEGTSYHYLPPSYEIEPTKSALEAIKTTLSNLNVPYKLTKTWTTDGVYRETSAKAKLRRENGCDCVEMEAAALFAVAKFRNVELAQILYAGDDLGGEFWDSRNYYNRSDIRKKVFELALTACSKL